MNAAKPGLSLDSLKQAARPVGLNVDDHDCHCGDFGSYGFRARWFCRDHVPDEFWDTKRLAEGKPVPVRHNAPEPLQPGADLPLMRAAR